MRLAFIALMACLALTIPSSAQAPILPSLDLSPEDVLSIQLKALSDAENNPTTNSGIARVWAFAHPSNRAVTGPLPRFRLMLQSPNYRALVGHRSHHMKQVSLTVDKAHYVVRITSGNGADFGYSWHLGRVANGQYKGMWMTTSVALVGKLGQSL